MTLSEHERQTLRDIDRWFLSNDPDLDQTFRILSELEHRASFNYRYRICLLIGASTLTLGLGVLTIGAFIGSRTLVLGGLFVAFLYLLPIALGQRYSK